MKIVVVMDSFKGSLSSIEAGDAVKKGILKAISEANVDVRPLADGGEGTVEALTFGMDGKLETIEVTGPLGEKVACSYGIVELEKDAEKKEDINNNLTQNVEGVKKKIAIIEMAKAAGITLVPKEKRNPLYTTTYGVGEVVKDAISKGCRHFIVGIGGSATNDGGIGMLQALGYGILDKNGNQVKLGAVGLEEIETITDEDVIPELKECIFRVACDVTNPLCGELGCSAVFGQQKGATSLMIERMDQWLSNYAKLASDKYKKADANYPGTGAAGGLGFAFHGFTNAVLESGVKIILEETRLEDDIKNADIVITGEGRLDGQTIYGKAPIGVAKLAKQYDKPVIAFSGSVTEKSKACNEHGIDAFFPILRSVQTLEEAMDCNNAKENLSSTVEQVFRLIKIKSLYFCE